MLIVIPTFKRNHCLPWVLQSLVQSKIENIPDSIRVLVVNNYPPAAKEIEKIVGQFSDDSRFTWSVLYRKKSLPAVENWYSAIFDNALPNEVVFINADDDLLLPDSLESRFRDIVRSGADLLLAKLGNNIFFSEDGRQIFCENLVVEKKVEEIKQLKLEDMWDFSPQHLSNNCYRNTKELQLAFKKAMSWCEELDWLDSDSRTLFLPLYMPYAISLCSGTVYGCFTQSVLRGRDVKEITDSKFGVPSWNHGFIHLCALIVLKNSELKECNALDEIRKLFRREYVKGFFTYFFDGRVGWNKWWKTHLASDEKFFHLVSGDLVYGALTVAKFYARVQGVKIARMANHHSVYSVDFMVKLSRLNES